MYNVYTKQSEIRRALSHVIGLQLDSEYKIKTSQTISFSTTTTAITLCTAL